MGMHRHPAMAGESGGIVMTEDDRSRLARRFPGLAAGRPSVVSGARRWWDNRSFRHREAVSPLQAADETVRAFPSVTAR